MFHFTGNSFTLEGNLCTHLISELTLIIPESFYTIRKHQACTCHLQLLSLYLVVTECLLLLQVGRSEAFQDALSSNFQATKDIIYRGCRLLRDLLRYLSTGWQGHGEVNLLTNVNVNFGVEEIFISYQSS